MTVSIRRETPQRASIAAVLEHAWDAGTFRADDIMDRTGLTRSTTISGIDSLIELGLVRELANARTEHGYRTGRPARRFELCADAGMVVGMDAGRAHVTTILADLRGHRLATTSFETDLDADADQRRRDLTESLDATLRAVDAPRSELLSVCVGVPAPVDADGRSPSHRDGFWPKSNPELLTHITPWAPIVQLSNDASLAALAEGTEGAAQDSDNYVALLSGARFGMGVVIDGHLLHGRHGGVGETVVFGRIEGVDDPDGLGQTIARWARQELAAGRIGPEHPLAQLPPALVTAQHVLQLAHEGDSASRELTARAAAMLSRITGMIGSFYDPEIVVVSGAVSAGIHDVVAAARSTLAEELDLPAPRLIASTLGAEVVAIGAVAAAVAAARDGVLALTPERTFAR
ncbi:ROK family protein [Microbacterium sp.]|uniref:ROK family protein n=1 Tax=Microbacterium sp. TaxID=51671 RepID=UPI0039E3BA11